MMEGKVSGFAVMPFAETLGIELVAAAPGEVRARLAWHERLCTAGGILHGGVLMALADSTGALCASLNLPGDTNTTSLPRTGPLACGGSLSVRLPGSSIGRYE